MLYWYERWMSDWGNQLPLSDVCFGTHSDRISRSVKSGIQTHVESCGRWWALNCAATFLDSNHIGLWWIFQVTWRKKTHNGTIGERKWWVLPVLIWFTVHMIVQECWMLRWCDSGLGAPCPLYMEGQGANQQIALPRTEQALMTTNRSLIKSETTNKGEAGVEWVAGEAERVSRSKQLK